MVGEGKNWLIMFIGNGAGVVVVVVGGAKRLKGKPTVVVIGVEVVSRLYPAVARLLAKVDGF